MNTFQEVFPNPHTFLAVVHVENKEQALRNVAVAQKGGADGVFLINHSMSYVDLLEIYQAAKKDFPEYWIGLNCLDIGRSAVDVIPKDTQGLWVDNAGINGDADELSLAEYFARRRLASEWDGLYFGGVAFKYQQAVADVREVARQAVPFVDVITTSGAGTGEAADLYLGHRYVVAL